jgi:predicted nucleic acid-binding protein
MNDRFFLDTKIIVYALPANPSGKRDRAAELVDRAIGSGKGAISYQVEKCKIPSPASNQHLVQSSGSAFRETCLR